MTGRYLVPLCKNRFFVSAHTCPFHQLTLTLSPTSGDSLRACILSFMYSFSIRTLWQNKTPLPSFLSGGQNWNDDRRENIIWLLAKNPAEDNWKCVVINNKNYNSFFLSCKLPPNTEGSAEPCEAIGASLHTQVRIFKSCTLCPDSSLRSRMTGRLFNTAL